MKSPIFAVLVAFVPLSASASPSFQESVDYLINKLNQAVVGPQTSRLGVTTRHSGYSVEDCSIRYSLFSVSGDHESTLTYKVPLLDIGKITGYSESINFETRGNQIFFTQSGQNGTRPDTWNGKTTLERFKSSARSSSSIRILDDKFFQRVNDAVKHIQKVADESNCGRPKELF